MGALSMNNTFEKVCQLNLSMKEITPQIWRRVQVPETCTFLDLHKAIQAVMNWEDYYLHEFEVLNPKTERAEIIGPEEDKYIGFDIELPVPEEKTRLSDYLTPDNKDALYTYNFGDYWQVKIRLEEILPKKEGVKYPVCLAGERASVPEDVGGIWGYEDMLEILNDPEHDEYEDTVLWLGKDFNPEYFDPKDITF